MRARAGLALAALLGALTVAPAHADACISLPTSLNGTAAVDALGSDLPRAASRADMAATTLRKTLKTDSTLWLDTCARPYYVEQQNTAGDQTFEPALATTDALTLHSRPGSKRTLFLDFDGMDITGKVWTEQYGAFTAPGYSIDDDPAFNATELARIENVWLRVAEDYAPFDVDVTTEDPGDAAIERTNLADDVYGTRVAIVGTNPIYAKCRCGGVAYVSVFDQIGDHEDFQPAFVFTQGVGTGSKSIAEAAAHEAGHNLGLYHDGLVSGAAYYRGQGVWAPIMGVGYYRPLTQWSQGEYGGANRTEDDLAVIAATGAPRMSDDVGDNRATAANLNPGTTEGLIGTAQDTDWYRFTAQDLTTITVTPQAVSPDLDARLDLYDAAGSLLASDDAVSEQVSTDIASGLDASIAQVLPAGTYYVRVDGVGVGSPTETGYSDYASLGRYELSLTTDGEPALVMTRQVLAGGTVDSPFEASFGATGGNPPYSYAVVAGTLPPGLSLSTDGLLAGAPTIAGSYTFTLEVSDADSASARGTFTIAVNTKPVTMPAPATPAPAPPPTPVATQTPAVTSVPPVTITTKRHLPKARVGKRYSEQLQAVNALSWHATGVPKGLEVDADGWLSGRPKKRGVYHLTAVATGSAGQTDSRTFTLRVRRAAR